MNWWGLFRAFVALEIVIIALPFVVAPSETWRYWRDECRKMWRLTWDGFCGWV